MVAAVSMVKDEADIVAVTVGHMARQVDLVIVADNGSTDETRQILDRLGVKVVIDPEPGYYQSRKMSALALAAAEQGADWVVPFDADEVWTAQGGHIATELEALPPEAMVAEADVFDHVATGGPGLSPWRRPEQLPLRKVACRPRPEMRIAQGNQGVSYPDDPHPLSVTGLLEVRHFPHRSPEQMIRKARNGAAAYAASDLSPKYGAHWRQWGELSDEQLREVFFEHYFSADPEADGLAYDPKPWTSRS